MAMNNYKTALVTGASSGVGAACTRTMTEAGFKVIALARREDRLAALAADTACEPLVLDLKDTDAVYAALKGREIDVLVNNAGLGRGYEGFLKSSPEEINEMIDLNLSAAIHVTHAVLGGMIERGRGHMLHIGSIAGLYPLGFPVYGATKGGIHSFAQHLRMELKGSGVRQTEVCPGRIATEFFDTAFKSEDDRKAFMDGFEALKAEDIVGAIMYAIGTPQNVNVSLIELTPTQQMPGGAIIDRNT
ncbi:MAG: SDR family oxidoreductase [Alphaproteobacteria bacterium]|nr:SDR family oxidoreductase [Alphaproteobacteria bacterium]